MRYLISVHMNNEIKKAKYILLCVLQAWNCRELCAAATNSSCLPPSLLTSDSPCFGGSSKSWALDKLMSSQFVWPWPNLRVTEVSEKKKTTSLVLVSSYLMKIKLCIIVTYKITLAVLLLLPAMCFMVGYWWVSKFSKNMNILFILKAVEVRSFELSVITTIIYKRC